MIDQMSETIPIGASVQAALMPLLAALPGQSEASHLCESLALAEGFQFQMVTCATPRTGAALLLWLDTEISRRRGEPVSMVRLSPYDFGPFDASTDLTPEQLTRLILEPLVSPPETDGSRLVFIDATPASSHDHDLWVWLFQRLNERRNVFASRIQAPLTLCLPTALESAFIRAAPDLWSIRSLAVTIREPLVPSPVAPLSLRVEPATRAPEDLTKELETARRAAASGHPASLRRLAIVLLRHAGAETTAGRLDEAFHTLSAEVLPLCERIGDAKLRAGALSKIAHIHELRGEIETALTLLREQVLPIYESEGDARARAITWGTIAHNFRVSGQLDEALRIFQQEVLPVFEAQKDVYSRALTLGLIASILQARGQFDEALRIHQEELPVYEQLGDVRSRAITWGQIADILQSRGQLDEAWRILQRDVLPVFEALGDMQPRAATLVRLAGILQARGQFDEALRILQDEVLPVYERLGNVYTLAGTWAQIADLLQARSQFDEALQILQDEVLPVYEQMGDANALEGHLRLGSLYLQRRGQGDDAKATEQFRAALHFADALHQPQAEKIREVLAQLEKQGP